LFQNQLTVSKGSQLMSAISVSDMHAPWHAPGAKVLVAEDHEDTRYLLRTILERCGFAVVEARDGVEAVAAAVRERPDIILMDGGLPLLDGIAATRRMRGVPALSAVPIVFLSGHAGPKAQIAALDAGCDEYVVKPFEIARLETVLNRHLRARGVLHSEGV
jgi:CheY-like chemotaxis protein